MYLIIVFKHLLILSQILCGAFLGRGTLTLIFENGLGYMTNMAATSIYGKNLQNGLSYLMARSNLVTYAFEREKLFKSHLMRKIEQMIKLTEDLCF